MNLSVALCCMLMAATASGLTMGVVSLDELELRVKERNVNESKTERGCASGATCREAAPQTAADAATLHGPARTGGLAGEPPTTSQVRDADSAADPAVASAPAAGVAAAAERDRKRGDAALSGQAGPSLGRHPHLRHRGPLRWRDHPRRGLYRPCQDEERPRPLPSARCGTAHCSLLTQLLLRSRIAALLSPLAWFIVMLSSPISYPLGWALRRPLPTRTARNLPRHFPAPSHRRWTGCCRTPKTCPRGTRSRRWWTCSGRWRRSTARARERRARDAERWPRYAERCREEPSGAERSREEPRGAERAAEHKRSTAGAKEENNRR